METKSKELGKQMTTLVQLRKIEDLINDFEYFLVFHEEDKCSIGYNRNGKIIDNNGNQIHDILGWLPKPTVKEQDGNIVALFFERKYTLFIGIKKGLDRDEKKFDFKTEIEASLFYSKYKKECPAFKTGWRITYAHILKPNRQRRVLELSPCLI